jgi:hypothetical protein
VGAAFGDAQAGCDVAQPRARVVGEAQQDPGVVGQETPAFHLQLSIFVDYSFQNYIASFLFLI